ncbi:hypothetical protein [Acidicapsa acidisoli]|uniref:hypothetical protein n=1 Tax=Acidicapsa acidisoli TaxID=1615681 RepID=UPI0021E0A3C7|nr:hypothetical protein [Acidicapsa acidisoli]
MSGIRPYQKIKKTGPFDLSAILPEYTSFSHLLGHAVGELKELPDFSEDTKIAIMSDFSGEHKGASYNTYSFLIMAYNKVGPFQAKAEELRRKYGYGEFAFKDLTYGPRSRALPEFLNLVDNFIHGAVVTIAIDKRIGTVFGQSKQDTHPYIQKQLAELKLGRWKGEIAEKVLRVCHSIALFTALTTHANQKLLWYCDDDAINQDAQERSFEDTQNIFVRTLGMYCKHDFELIGFAKSFTDKTHLDDLLSIPDLAAGAVQDILHAHTTGDDNVPGGSEKEALIRWIASQGKFLSKITLQISPLPGGQLGSGVVHITPKSTTLQ